LRLVHDGWAATKLTALFRHLRGVYRRSSAPSSVRARASVR